MAIIWRLKVAPQWAANDILHKNHVPFGRLARTARADLVQLHNIETGKRPGSIETFAKIAAALDGTVDDLI